MLADQKACHQPYPPPPQGLDAIGFADAHTPAPECDLEINGLVAHMLCSLGEGEREGGEMEAFERRKLSGRAGQSAATGFLRWGWVKGSSDPARPGLSQFAQSLFLSSLCCSCPPPRTGDSRSGRAQGRPAVHRQLRQDGTLAACWRAPGPQDGDSES